MFTGIVFKGEDEINPDEIVAYGATLLARNLNLDCEIERLHINNAIPLTLGTDVREVEDIDWFVKWFRNPVERSVMRPLIKKNTTYPVTKHMEFTTHSDNQTFITVLVLEGEEEDVNENYVVDQITIHNLRPAPAGEVKIQLIFNVDLNGILKTTVHEVGTDNIIMRRHEKNSFNLTELMIANFRLAMINQ